MAVAVSLQIPSFVIAVGLFHEALRLESEASDPPVSCREASFRPDSSLCRLLSRSPSRRGERKAKSRTRARQGAPLGRRMRDTHTHTHTRTHTHTHIHAHKHTCP